jgi:hypothetical protein
MASAQQHEQYQSVLAKQRVVTIAECVKATAQQRQSICSAFS